MCVRKLNDMILPSSKILDSMCAVIITKQISGRESSACIIWMSYGMMAMAERVLSELILNLIDRIKPFTLIRCPFANDFIPLVFCTFGFMVKMWLHLFRFQTIQMRLENSIVLKSNWITYVYGAPFSVRELWSILHVRESLGSRVESSATVPINFTKFVSVDIEKVKLTFLENHKCEHMQTWFVIRKFLCNGRKSSSWN